MKPWLLLDGDLILFRNAIACEKETKWDEENWVLWCNTQQAWENFESAVEHYRKTLNASRVTLCFTESRCFRYDLAPDYKANRIGGRKPLGYNSLVEKAKETFEWKSMQGLEADDVMGILATTKTKTPKIIVSDDKDLKTIPGTLYRNGDLLTITEDEADHWQLYQTLIGDTADGFKGLPGCGPKGAEKILTHPEDSVDPYSTYQHWAWDAVCRAFEAKGLTEADALIQARLARILRASDWDNTKKEPILWQPPTRSAPDA